MRNGNCKKINTIIDEKASVSLDNLDTDGQAIIDGKVSSSDLFDENEHIKINNLQSFSMPSNSYTKLSIGSSGSDYIAPADGWFFANGERNANSGVGDSATITLETLGLGDQSASGYYFSSRVYTATKENEVDVIHPVSKGQILRLLYLRMTMFNLIFVYALGSEPQS